MANNLLQERINLIIEYIEQILTDGTPVHGKINLNKIKLENKNTIVLDIFVPIKNFERHFNLGIEGSREERFYFLLIDHIYNKYLNYEYLAVSNLYSDTNKTETISMRNAINGLDITFHNYTKKTKEMFLKKKELYKDKVGEDK